MGAWVVSGCGGNPPPAPATADKVAVGEAAAPIPGTLQRSAVIEVVDRGLGEFLQRVEVEPSLENGKFQGFRLLNLLPPEAWANVDLHPADVVTHVNGQFVEDPNLVFEMFTKLKSASELRVDLIREGKPMALRFPILGPSSPPKPEASSGAAASGAPNK